MPFFARYKNSNEQCCLFTDKLPLIVGMWSAKGRWRGGSPLPAIDIGDGERERPRVSFYCYEFVSRRELGFGHSLLGDTKAKVDFDDGESVHRTKPISLKWSKSNRIVAD